MKFRMYGAALAAAAVFAPQGASALTFNMTFTPESTAADILAFTQAGQIWSSLLSDEVTINLNVGTATLNPGVLAQAGSTRVAFDYSSYYASLAADASSAADSLALGTLSTSSSFDMLLNRTSNNPNGYGSATAYVDSDGDANNSTIRLTSANAKALGLTVTATSDASITFSNQFSWDYDASDGVDAGSYDFVGIAVHEIGHSLGFISGIDILDGNSPPGSRAYSDDQFTYVAPLDLYRYSLESAALGVIDWTASTVDKYFSLDGGATSIASFSTGVSKGDGRQASHWKDNLGIGIMDPTAGTGESLMVSANDLLAFDVIGWNVAAVPEPSTYAMMALGLLGIAGLRRRRQGRDA